MYFIYFLSVSFFMFCSSFIPDCLVQIICNNFEFKRGRKNNKDLSLYANTATLWGIIFWKSPPQFEKIKYH